MSNDDQKPLDPLRIGVLDPATFPARSTRPAGIANPEIQLLCVRCWSPVSGFSEPKCSNCSVPRPMHGWPTLPYVFRQRYLFLRPIGRGGMGAVFLAYDEQQQQSTRVPLAVKVVPQASSDEAREQLRELFEREASAAAMLAQAPHFVRVLAHDVGVDPAFLVMEHVDWPTLRDCIRQAREDGRTRGLSSVVVARIGIAVLRGVSVMHYHRVVHRDLKPSNIFFRKNESDDFDIKILDFGVWTREASGDGPQDSVVGLGHRLDQVPVGTYSYMSPEQMAGRPVDARSNLHTLGSVLWELVTGDVPYRMNNALQGRALQDRFERLRSLPLKPEGMTDGFYEVLARSLAFEPKDRWESAEEMKLALKVWLAEEVLRSRSVFSGCAGRIETLDAQVEHVKLHLAPARDFLQQVDQLAGLVYLLKSQAEDATPEAISGAVEEMEDRIGGLAKELSVFSRDVLESSQRLSREKTEDLGPSADIPLLPDPANHRVAAFVGPFAPRFVLLASVFSALVAAVAFSVVLAKRRPGEIPRPVPSAPITTPTLPPMAARERPVRISAAGHALGPVFVTLEESGNRVLTGGRDGVVMHMDPKSGSTRRIASFSAAVVALDAHPTASLAALGLADGRLVLLETSSGRVVFERHTEDAPLDLVRFWPKGRFVVFPDEGDTLRILKSDSLELRVLGTAAAKRRSSSKSGRGIRDFAFSEDDRTVFALGAKGLVSTFDLESGRSLRKPLDLGSRDVTQIALTKDGTRLLYGDRQGRMFARALEAGAPRVEISASAEARLDGFVVDRERVYVARASGGIEALDPSGKNPPTSFATEIGRVASMYVDRDGGHLVVAGRDRRVHLIRLSDRNLEKTFPAGPVGLAAMALAPDGRQLAVAETTTGLVRVLDAKSLVALRLLDGPKSGLLGLSFLRDGRLVGSDEDGLLWLWSKSEDTAVRLGSGAAFPVTALVADPEQPRIFVARDKNGIEQIDVQSGRVVRRLDSGRGLVTGLALSPDGALLAATRQDGQLSIFETEKSRQLHALEVSKRPLRAVAFSPDGRSLASTGEDGAVWVHRTDTGILLRTHRDDAVPSERIAFSVEGLFIVSAKVDGSVRVFEAGGPRRLIHIPAHHAVVTGLVTDLEGALTSVGLDGTLRRHAIDGELRSVAGGASRDWLVLAPGSGAECPAPACSMFRMSAVD